MKPFVNYLMFVNFFKTGDEKYLSESVRKIEQWKFDNLSKHQCFE